MNSKYPLHPDFTEIKDSKKNPESKLLLRLGNMLIRSQAKSVKADGNEVVEEQRMMLIQNQMNSGSSIELA